MHFDLKSANILLARDNTAKIADVGLAKIMHRQFLSSLYNVGTFAWSAPEVSPGEGVLFMVAMCSLPCLGTGIRCCFLVDYLDLTKSLLSCKFCHKKHDVHSAVARVTYIAVYRCCWANQRVLRKWTYTAMEWCYGKFVLEKRPMADSSDLSGTPPCTSAVCIHGCSFFETLLDIFSLTCCACQLAQRDV